jgi:hypothetical protein
VNKKKQKNFAPLGPCRFNVSGPAAQKFFAPLFFKKAATFLFPLKPITLKNGTDQLNRCVLLVCTEASSIQKRR